MTGACKPFSASALWEDAAGSSALYAKAGRARTLSGPAPPHFNSFPPAGRSSAKIALIELSKSLANLNESATLPDSISL